MTVKTENTTTEDLAELASDFVRLKKKVFETTPILKEIVEKNGNQSLFDHAREYQNIEISSLALTRRHELISTVAERTKNLLGAEAADSISKQLGKYYYASTVDHHSPVCHPFFLNANLITATPYAELADPVLQNVIVFSCANVSLNNSSFPRDLIFHSDVGDSEQLQHLSFFPAKDRAQAVYGHRSYTNDDLIRIKKDLLLKVKRKQVSQEAGDKILEVLDSIYAQEVPLKAKDFSGQITQTNVHLWQRFFSPQDQAPRLVYLDQESIVGDLLIKYHLGSDTIINRMLFDEKYSRLITKYFDGIIGAFSMVNQTGTFLFWALPKGEKYRQQLWKQGNELVSADGKFRVLLNARAIAEKLQSGELIPSMLVTFMVLSFYYGLTCLGGFSQPSYLTLMKEAYLSMMEEAGDKENRQVCQSVETKGICGDMSLAFLRDKNGALYQATGLDLILYGTENTWSKLVELSKSMTIGEALDLMMPLFYEVMYPENQREERLKNITANQIIQLTGLDKKIKPCVEM